MINANMDSVSSLISDIGPNTNANAKDPIKETKSEGKSFSQILRSAEKQETPRTHDVAPVSEPLPAPKSIEKMEAEQETTPVAAQKTQEKSKKEFEDQAGVMGASYDKIAVSYPVSRVAKESLDEKVINQLQDQGLWNLPTLVMAQPTVQLVSMKDALEQPQFEKAVPVAKPIAQFMASLENELGVKPDRLVQAFQKLPSGQMQLSPEKTMAQVIKNLDLKPMDQTKAVALYEKMLTQLETLDEPTSSQAFLAKGAALDPNVAKVFQEPQKAEGKLARASNVAAKYGRTMEQASQLPPNQNLEGKSDFASKVDRPEVTPVIATESHDLGKEKKVADENVKNDSVAPTLSAFNGSTKTEIQVASDLQQPKPAVLATNVPSALDAMKNASVSVEEKVPSEVLKTATKTVSKKEELFKSLGSTDKSDLASASAVRTYEPNLSSISAPAVATADSKVISGDSKQEAIRSIMNQTQLLAQKGGGEIHMTLKPDHLGEIQLKVAMEGNRVNVQMTTDRGEVKRLIEQSVHELRHGLASQNLSMEKLDVNVGNRDMSGFSKGQPDFGAARDFAQQFHQQQGNRREMLDDLSSLRSNAQRSMTTLDRSAQVQKTFSNRGQGRLSVMA